MVNNIKTWNMEHTKLIKTLNLQVGSFWWTDRNLAAGSWCDRDRAVSCLRQTRISNTFFYVNGFFLCLTFDRYWNNNKQNILVLILMMNNIKTWNMEHTKLIKTLNLQVGSFWWTDSNLAAGSWCDRDRAVSCLRHTRISNTFFK